MRSWKNSSAIFFLFSFVLFFTSVTAHSETLENYLKAFHRNPAQMMQRLPAHVNQQGEMLLRGYIDEQKNGEMIPYRDEVRKQLIHAGGLFPNGDILAGTEKDRPERLIEPGALVVRNLREMQSRSLTKGLPEPLPWADSYWPIYKGLTAVRYSDKSFPNSIDWMVNYQYVNSRPASMIVASRDSAEINSLSPAEKYDFVMGDSNFTLTNYAWGEGQRRYQQEGRVAKWMGICHGWAGASHMQAKVLAAPVTVIAANGEPVTFYPQDVKALQSMLWANASLETRFVGDRCDVSHPPRDAFGRVLDEKCFNVNPATWHIAVTNQIGVQRRSFVMDATYDAEVWNYPLVSYKYNYFNPQNLLAVSSLDAALIPVEAYTLDKFKVHRAVGTKYVVGIYMDVEHVAAINPRRTVSTAPMVTKTIRFIYDLELDENLNVIGGEWYSNAHPDFIWTYNRDAQALGVGDKDLLSANWNYFSPVPFGWSESAKRASLRGTPLFSFIKGLVDAGPLPATGVLGTR